MFHRHIVASLSNGKGYNRPPVFGTIAPTEDIYKCGGMILRTNVPETGTVEDVMVCNDAFCSNCAFLFGRPASGDPDYYMDGMPFIHTVFLDASKISIIKAGEQIDAQFEAGSICDLATVPAKAARQSNAISVTFLDGYQRSAEVCDPATCQKCKTV